MATIDKRLGQAEVGPGGRACPCCWPAPKTRKLFLRHIKREKVKQWIRNEMLSQMEGD